MKKLLFLFIIIPLALRSMENDNNDDKNNNEFESIKTSFETSLAEFQPNNNNKDNFKKWKKAYDKLLAELPDNSQALGALLEIVQDQNYTNPIFLYLAHTKKQEASTQQSTPFWQSLFKSTPKKDNIENNITIEPIIDEEMENYVVQAAQDYGIMLPHTDFAKQVWKNESVPIKSCNIIYKLGPLEYKFPDEGNKINATISSIDLEYLPFLPNSDQIKAGLFTKMDLTKLPKNLSLLKNLIALTLAANQLTDLPESLSSLHKLKVLSLNCNKFEKLPDVIKKLSSLEILTANNNQLTIDPTDSIVTLKKLRHLSLSQNKLTHLSSNKLPESLKTLNLANNQLKELSAIPENSQLEYIILTGNQLLSMPYEALFNLKKLKVYNFTNSKNTDIEVKIKKLNNNEND